LTGRESRQIARPLGLRVNPYNLSELLVFKCCDIIARPGSRMGGSRMGRESYAELFNCPSCNSQYKLVRAEADHTGSYGQIECYHCGGPLKGREGQFILKYFLVDRPRKQLRPSRVK
jgi:hypothetical protein